MKKTIAEMEQTAASEAAQKLISIFDEGSFTQLGKFIGSNGQKASVVSGYGCVDSAAVYAYTQDISVNSGAVDTAAANKIKKVYELAMKNGAPVIGIFNSNGADIKEGMKVLGAYSNIAAMSASLSGVVPQIAIIDGVCAGAAAMIACMADIVIVTEKSELFMTAPFVADDSVNGAGTAENAARSGVAAIVAKDIDEALATAKRLISVLPANNLETAGNDYFEDNDTVIAPSLKGAALIEAVADKNSVIPLYEKFGTDCVTALASVNWRTVGFVAANGRLTAADSAKIARFVTMCDAFSIPVVTFVDTEGFEKSSAAELAGSIRDSAKLAQTYACATTPKISVVTGKAYGSSYVALAGISSASDISVAWEEAVIAPVAPEAAAVFLNGVSADNAKQAQQYAEEEADAFTACANGYVDLVISADMTRSTIISAIETISSKRVISPAKKHVNFVF